MKQDPGIPTCDETRVRFVMSLVQAMTNTCRVTDSPAVVARWQKTVETDSELIELRAWRLLVSPCCCIAH